MEERVPFKRIPRLRMPPVRQIIFETGGVQGHHMYAIGGGEVGCMNCCRHGRLKSVWPWVLSFCPGPGASQGHNVQSIHGLYFCTSCGRYSSKQGGWNGLKKPCSRKPTRYGARLLNRLCENPPRPPMCKKSWPDGTPIVQGPSPNLGFKRRRNVRECKGGLGSSRGGCGGL